MRFVRRLRRFAQIERGESVLLRIARMSRIGVGETADCRILNRRIMKAVAGVPAEARRRGGGCGESEQ